MPRGRADKNQRSHFVLPEPITSCQKAQQSRPIIRPAKIDFKMGVVRRNILLKSARGEPTAHEKARPSGGPGFASWRRRGMGE